MPLTPIINKPSYVGICIKIHLQIPPFALNVVITPGMSRAKKIAVRLVKNMGKPKNLNKLYFSNTSMFMMNGEKIPTAKTNPNRIKFAKNILKANFCLFVKSVFLNILKYWNAFNVTITENTKKKKAKTKKRKISISLILYSV